MRRPAFVILACRVSFDQSDAHLHNSLDTLFAGFVFQDFVIELAFLRHEHEIVLIIFIFILFLLLLRLVILLLLRDSSWQLSPGSFLPVNRRLADH
jgi:hypothetical protein